MGQLKERHNKNNVIWNEGFIGSIAFRGNSFATPDKIGPEDKLIYSSALHCTLSSDSTSTTDPDIEVVFGASSIASRLYPDYEEDE